MCPRGARRVQAAADAQACLADGVYLHGHEGYLLEQFANPAFNRRKWGRFADPEALAGAIGAILGDEGRRLAMAAAAQDRARRHDADWTAARFLALYSALHRRGERSA